MQANSRAYSQAIYRRRQFRPRRQDSYWKWLKYYLDFRVKYPPPDNKSEQVRLFIEKIRSKVKMIFITREQIASDFRIDISPIRFQSLHYIHNFFIAIFVSNIPGHGRRILL